MEGYNFTLSKCPHCLVAEVDLQLVFDTAEIESRDRSNFKSWSTYQCKVCNGVIVAYRYRFEKDSEMAYPLIGDVVSRNIVNKQRLFFQWEETTAYTKAKVHPFFPKSVSSSKDDDWEHLHSSDMSGYIRLNEYVVRLEEDE